MKSVLYIARKTRRYFVVKVTGIKRAHVIGMGNIATFFATRVLQSTLATTKGRESVCQTGMVKIAVNFATTAQIVTHVLKKVVKFVYQGVDVHPIAQKLNQFVIFICAIMSVNQQLALTNGYSVVVHQSV